MSGQADWEMLLRAIGTVRGRIAKFQSTKGFNEQNTKASLIDPILQALDWVVECAAHLSFSQAERRRLSPSR